MRNAFILICTLMISVTGAAQNLVKAEYFFNNDPGIGNGTPIIMSSPGANVSFTATIPTGALSPGFHFLGMRLQQSDGLWGLFESRGFYISTAVSSSADITAAEYFFDTDPGAGNGTAMGIPSGSVSNFTVSLPAGSLSSGFHFLAIRVKGTDGKWGLFESRGFYITESTSNVPDIVAAEYFFDTDPGIGSGIGIPVTTGATVNFSVPLPSGSLSPGFHFLAIRTKLANGKWGLFESRGFYVSSATTDAADIVAAEYFFDNDPGTGTGIPISIPSGSTSNFTVSLPVASLSTGFHFLAIRTKGSDGKWSLFETRGFYVSTDTDDAGDIIAAEYFFDTDPGEGNGLSLTVTAGATVNEIFTFPISSALTAGTHSISIRVKSAKGVWSVKESGTFTVLPNQSPVAVAGNDQNISFPITSAGLDGTASSDPDGSISTYSWVKISGPASGSVANSAQATTTADSLVDGVYAFELTVTDNNGISDKDTVQITVIGPPNQPPVANAGSDQVIGLPVNTTTVNGSSSTDTDGSIVSYAWVKVSGPVSGSIANADQVSTIISNLTIGVYQLELSVTDNNGAVDKDTVRITVVNGTSGGCPSPPEITLSGNLLICNPSGSSFQWYKDGVAIPGAVTQILEIDLLEYGIYAVDVTSNDCTVRSPDFMYLITGGHDNPVQGKIYPNPFTNIITIEWQTKSPEVSVLIIDALGRTVKQQGLSPGRNDILTEDLSQGIYYLLIDRKFRFKIQKL